MQIPGTQRIQNLLLFTVHRTHHAWVLQSRYIPGKNVSIDHPNKKKCKEFPPFLRIWYHRYLQIVHFGGYSLGKAHSHTVRVVNISRTSQRLHILGPSTDYFKVRMLASTHAAVLQPCFHFLIAGQTHLSILRSELPSTSHRPLDLLSLLRYRLVVVACEMYGRRALMLFYKLYSFNYIVDCEPLRYIESRRSSNSHIA